MMTFSKPLPPPRRGRRSRRVIVMEIALRMKTVELVRIVLPTRTTNTSLDQEGAGATAMSKESAT